jgi:hypothetical protein
MSRNLIDFNPLLKKVQTDISLLCYLGLHQYAKENNLIGRSRPMITPELDFVKQKRLNFRLMVACLQQIIGSKTMDHRGVIEQVNYVNVGEYSIMRLYGLFDKEMFAVYTDEDKCYTGWWPQQVDARDYEPLRSPAPLETITGDLGYNTRAMLEVGGGIFAGKLREAIRLIPNELWDFVPHQQRDPRNRMNVKNIAVQLKLVETKHYRTFHQRRTTGLTYAHDSMHDMFNVPTHIEQLLHFRHVLWPWIQVLRTDQARDAFSYIAQNYPSVPAVQMKMRQIRESAQERERLARLQQERQEQQERDREQLRERLLAVYGDRQHDTEEEAVEGEPVFEMGQEEPVEVVPIPDVHHGAIPPYRETYTEIRHRINRALGIRDTREEDDEDDTEIPF